MATDPAFVQISANSTATPAPPIQAPLPRALSCVLCAQRRVKCNKQQPCTNCIKARVECVQTIPNRSRRRRRRTDGAEEDLLARCKRYERLLLSYGATKEVLDTGDTSLTMRSSDFKSLDITTILPSDAEPAASSHLAALPGKNSLWVSLSDEILDISDDDLLQSTPEAPYVNEDDISFVFESYPSRASLILPHPKPVFAFQLWQVFVDNVNPLTKIIHVPTFQKQLIAAMGDLENIPKTTEALLFSIYTNAVNSLSDSQLKAMMGESKSVLLTTYLNATQRAMTNAGLLRTVEVDLLRALVLYTICLHGKFDPQALCIFTGMAVRMAHRLGIHREDVLSKSTIFEAELRRRIWWQIITLEMHMAERAGVVTFSPRSWDTNIPSNINDENLDSDMRELPTEYVGTTEMCFTLIKCEAVTFTLETPALCGNPQYFTNPDVPVSVKEAVINDFKTVLGITTRMLLMCLHPRQYTDHDTNLPLIEKEKLFNLCLNLTTEENLLRANNFLKRFDWHFNTHFQTDAFIYLVHRLQSECVGIKADTAWPQIFQAFENRPEFLTNKNSLYIAIQRLILKSWHAREIALAKIGQVPPEGSPPNIIVVLRSLRAGSLFSLNPSLRSLDSIPLATTTQAFNAQLEIDSFDPNLGLVDTSMDIDASIFDWSLWGDLAKS